MNRLKNGRDRKGRRAGSKPGDDGLLDREIAFHLDAVTRKYIAEGMSPDDARRKAVLEFGGREQVKQQIREVHTSVLIESVRANLRSAMRFIRRAPSFALAIVLTLALGIGANSAVFSAIDAIVLRPLPFPHGDELVRLHQEDFKNKNPEAFVAPLRLEDWNRMNSTFQAISGYYTQDISLSLRDIPEKITEALVAPRFLEMWGVTPALGRDFTKEEEHFGGPNAVIVSDRFWRTHLHADPGAVGQALRLGNYSYTVIGVMPRSFLFPDRDVDVFEPNPVDAPYSQSRDSTWFTVIGRLKPGVSLASAGADMATVQSQLGKQYTKTDGSLTVRLEPLKSVVLGGIQNSLWLVYGSVSLLLLIACTNIAALLMARTAQREHEISIRYSLGASRLEIGGQLLTEVFVLAFAGSVTGLLVAAGSAHVFTLFSKSLPRVDEIVLNWRIVAYSLSCALAATLACGLFPAIRGTRRSLSGSLAQSTRTQVSTRNGWQWTLVGVQVSLAVALLISSGLLLRSFQALGRVQPGFDPSHVLTLRISGSWGETADMGKLAQRINRTLDGLRGVPGVEAAASSATVPGNDLSYPLELKVSEGSPDPNEKIIADMRWVSAGYFGALHIPVLQGEPCRDDLSSHTMVVNRSFAERYFSGGTVLGRHIGPASSNNFLQPAEVRGVVGDAREEGLDIAPRPTVYACFSAPTMDPHYLIRTHGDPMALADTIRRRIHELEPARSISDVMPLEDHLSDRLAENRLRTILLTSFALTAISLVCIGLYGTINYLGRIRQREVGLRLALGALPRQIVGRFLLQGLRVTLAGAVAGLLLGAAMSRLLAQMLYGVSALDPATYAGVLLLTLVVAAAASIVPAVRAARVEPTAVLREE
jgi:putative ABC transport system permease protein